jgi:outer membrane scaffolding protein for murein synthesis (MipA/OmpV family)
MPAMRCSVIQDKSTPSPTVRPFGIARSALLLALIGPIYCSPASGQTPSPLQEWQYSGGIILSRLFQPDQPEWHTVTGLAADLQPAYDGARAYRVMLGPVINVQYRDIAFASTGDGLGVNVFKGAYYRVGISLAYDLGRLERDDYTNLRGYSNIHEAPAAKIFASYVFSKDFPLVARFDARQIMGGVGGAVADVGAYMPLPGSSKNFIMFAGPSVTFATHHFLQNEFGVNASQALASGHPPFDPHSGLEAAGVGLSTTKFFGHHWLANVDAAFSKLFGGAADGPLTERSARHVVTFSVDYQW